jgi:hypothetical protein
MLLSEPAPHCTLPLQLSQKGQYVTNLANCQDAEICTTLTIDVKEISVKPRGFGFL